LPPPPLGERTEIQIFHALMMLANLYIFYEVGKVDCCTAFPHSLHFNARENLDWSSQRVGANISPPRTAAKNSARM
jgi:hypothetical protein